MPLVKKMGMFCPEAIATPYLLAAQDLGRGDYRNGSSPALQLLPNKLLQWVLLLPELLHVVGEYLCQYIFGGEGDLSRKGG